MTLDVTFVGADVLTPEGWSDAPLSVSGGQIVEASGRQVPLPGFRILPGIVDLHGDGFERHLAPRRGLVRDMTEGFLSLDAELAASGVTTAVLAQFWSWEGGMRDPAFARRVAEALAAARPKCLTDLRLQLRLEVHMIDTYDEAFDFVVEQGIDYVVLNDHLPHAELAAGKTPPRLTGQALKAGRNPQKHLAMMQDLAARRGEMPEALARLTSRLRGQGVTLGSHDDRDPEDRARLRALGVTVAEFPETMAAVEAAHEAGDPVLLGAPNVVRGNSHNGNLTAEDAVRAGLCDALVSDYHYPSLLGAMRRLGETPETLAAAWPLVSSRPAQVLGWTDRGGLTLGKRADLVILDPDGRLGATICGGQVSLLRGATASAVLAAL